MLKKIQLILLAISTISHAMETENATNNNNKQLTTNIIQERKKKIEEKFYYKLAYVGDDTLDFFVKKTIKDNDTLLYAFVDYMSDAIQAAHESKVTKQFCQNAFATKMQKKSVIDSLNQLFKVKSLEKQLAGDQANQVAEYILQDTKTQAEKDNNIQTQLSKITDKIELLVENFKIAQNQQYQSIEKKIEETQTNHREEYLKLIKKIDTMQLTFNSANNVQVEHDRAFQNHLLLSTQDPRFVQLKQQLIENTITKDQATAEILTLLTKELEKRPLNPSAKSYFVKYLLYGTLHAGSFYACYKLGQLHTADAINANNGTIAANVEQIASLTSNQAQIVQQITELHNQVADVSQQNAQLTNTVNTIQKRIESMGSCTIL